jgi:uncharacterized glyoxalase superfamily protein PhnB
MRRHVTLIRRVWAEMRGNIMSAFERAAYNVVEITHSFKGCRMRETKNWKPSGYSSASPYLVVAGAQKIIDFAKATFGAVELRRYDLPDGSIMHAEIRIDDTVVMLGDGGPNFPPFASLVQVYVEDVDNVFERALAAGATVVESPRTREGDPDKRGSVKDPCGNTWAIATQIRRI